MAPARRPTPSHKASTGRKRQPKESPPPRPEPRTRLPDAGPASPTLGFRLAVFLGALAADAPRRTEEGALHVTWRRGFEAKWGARGPFDLGIPSTLALLEKLGALQEGSPEDPRALDPVLARMDDLFTAQPEDLALACLATEDPTQGNLAALGRLRAACGRHPTRGADLAGIEAQPARPPNAWGWKDAPAAVGEDLVGQIQRLLDVGLAEHVSGGGSPRIRPAPPPAPAEGRWVVQPSFDLLVPWDAPPRSVARLGLVAALESVDRMCRYHLTKESVARGVTHFHHPDRVVGLLRDGTRHPLPQNVERTVTGWAASHRPLRSHAGEVVLAFDDRQREVVRSRVPWCEEALPGVFLLPPRMADAVYVAAREAGIPLGRRAQPGRPPAVVGPSDLQRLAAESRRMVDAVARIPRPR